ncbi:prenyltransferase/squalene oxidase repeat-containing protein [Thermosyntropha sp.]|uniref:prenyltransferase/squalene oxidase repeat-containing protein n=1 Tax=Thermosyntropha sp. TaxID=2740820 RepID=UPI0025F5AEAA|nr:prenyltransferase/squalene oxidase repeat-containing protein [Thermosyntropha sp.]MBO8159875.1 terpene cyclase/mutase family protein [Thermosyntropha sp.]
MVNVKFKKNIASVILLVLFLQLGFLGINPVYAATQDEINVALDKAAVYINANFADFTGGENDWVSLGLRKAGKLEKIIYQSQESESPSDYARFILGGLARGEDVAEYVYSLQLMQRDGGYFSSTDDEPTLNQTIWPVIALDFAEKNGVSVDYNRTKAVEYICSKQVQEGDYAGGFNESGWGIDIDSTAHALIALAPYKGEQMVSDTVYKAVNFLKAKQNDDAGFGFYIWEGTEYPSESPDSIAAVIEALIALGIDPQDDEWKKGDKTMVDALLKYQLSSGGFYGPWAPEQVNNMTTRNALLALADLEDDKSKYSHPLPELSSFYATVKAPAPKLDSDFEFELALNNPEGDKKDVLTVIGLYELSSPGKMLYYQALSREIDACEVENISGGMSLPAEGNYEVRIMIWDKWQNPQSIISPFVFKVKTE